MVHAALIARHAHLVGLGLACPRLAADGERLRGSRFTQGGIGNLSHRVHVRFRARGAKLLALVPRHHFLAIDGEALERVHCEQNAAGHRVHFVFCEPRAHLPTSRRRVRAARGGLGGGRQARTLHKMVGSEMWMRNVLSGVTMSVGFADEHSLMPTVRSARFSSTVHLPPLLF